jgi:hypothetical protein
MIQEDDYTGKDIYQLTFPEEVYGEVIEGIDLTILNLDSLRLIHAYAEQEGELSDIQWRVLRQCDEELRGVVHRIEGYAGKYFKRLHHAVREVLAKTR